ncbi:hypothetical protein RSOLAG1IB_09757 [Rhizoctonia solani AG-1 IB]|uniref:Cellobiose dehydrogenase-like cytochrome domain-containing protein n=1 Tax=Thanatephorus cucumeris (strain AG1-IB / isolate 7/3/14) TaxID=1108050 RepID=A0A0B7FT51_THACB|nr:hypothetical protein RSOLAG1IB_09757 [Rhizoctonia solani AG-1 IB]
MKLLSSLNGSILALLMAAQCATAAIGGTFCSTPKLMCVTATQVGSNTFYNLSTTVSRENFGWMAVGFGDRMVGTPAVVVWPNSDNTISLAQRKATEHASPPIDPAPPRVATLREDLSTLAGTPSSVLFSMPSSGNATEMMVFAFGTSNPRSKDPGALLIRHVWVYHHTMNLSQTVPDQPTFSSS